jgi:hypothetical protein
VFAAHGTTRGKNTVDTGGRSPFRAAWGQHGEGILRRVLAEVETQWTAPGRGLTLPTGRARDRCTATNRQLAGIDRGRDPQRGHFRVRNPSAIAWTYILYFLFIDHRALSTLNL